MTPRGGEEQLFLLTQGHLIWTLSMMITEEFQTEFIEWVIDNFADCTREITKKIIKEEWVDYAFTADKNTTGNIQKWNTVSD